MADLLSAETTCWAVVERFHTYHTLAHKSACMEVRWKMCKIVRGGKRVYDMCVGAWCESLRAGACTCDQASVSAWSAKTPSSPNSASMSLRRFFNAVTNALCSITSARLASQRPPDWLAGWLAGGRAGGQSCGRKACRWVGMCADAHAGAAGSAYAALSRKSCCTAAKRKLPAPISRRASCAHCVCVRACVRAQVCMCMRFMRVVCV